MEFKFDRPRLNKITKVKMLDELEKASKFFDYTEFSWRDFNKVANISANPIKKEFGSWKKALVSLREHLKQKNIDFSPRKFSPNRIYSDKELFEEMERIWKEKGHRPSRNEWEYSKPKISYNCYKKRFKGWTNACLKFIEYKMEKLIVLEDNTKIEITQKNNKNIKIYKRDIPLKLRLDVLKRDNFKCILCGRSPATDLGVILHIDHKMPFSRGGKTELENLQTLCQECNLGKGNRY